MLQADGEDALEQRLLRPHREAGALLLELERVDARRRRRADEAGDEEVVLPGVRQRRARVVGHARRPGVPVGDRRQDARGAAVEARLEDLLVDPDVVAVVLRVGVLAVLPVRAPAGLRAVRQVDDALLLARVVAVVVDADQVAALVERELLQVADARARTPRSWSRPDRSASPRPGSGTTRSCRRGR